VAKIPKTSSGSPERETNPREFPAVQPTAYSQAVDANFMAESVMRMSESVGELKATVGHLKTASDRQSTKLDRISHIVFAAGVVLTIVIGIAGFLLNKIWDGLVMLLKAGH
jgi:hypothetical protein